MNLDDFDRRVGVLRKAQELLGGSPDVAEALLPAVNAFYFIRESGHAYNFEDYLAGFRGTSFPLLGSFSRREEFDTWLKAHPGPPPRGVVHVAGERYTLGCSRVRGAPLLLRLPSVEALRRPGGEKEYDGLFLALDKAREVLGSSPEDLEVLASAALALHFIQETGCAREFARFLASFDDAFLAPICSFDTREEAEAWLRNHPSPPNGASVRVGEEELTVGYWRESGLRALLRFPKDGTLTPPT